MYRKIKPDAIFTGTAMLPPGNILIVDSNGTIEAIVMEAAAGDGIETVKGILSPGFVNGHCHIELSHLKGKVPRHTGLVSFVQQIMANRGAAEEEKQTAMIAAANELYESGTVAVADICNTTDSILLKKQSPLYWHNFIEISGFADSGAEKRLEAGKAILETFSSQLPGNSGLTPHAPYSVSKRLFELLNNQTLGQLISIHNQETEAEDELYLNKTGTFLELYQNFGIDISGFNATGKRSLPSWLPYFSNQQKIIAVHNSFTNQQDIIFAEQEKILGDLHFCLCPNANLYIENKLPPVELLLKNEGNILIGTDSYASNRSLNMMDEINTLQKHFPQIPLATLLQWATLNGATVLGIDHIFGSLEKGKKPGMVLIDEGVARRI